jgi:hypothetical protein
MPLVGCLPVQPCGLVKVLLYTATVVIHLAEIELGLGIPLIGCLTVQPRGLAEVLLHTLTFKVYDAEIELGAGVSLLRCVPQHANHLVHLTLQSLGERAPRRSPPIYPPLHVKVSPRRLIEKLLGSWRQLRAAHGARLLDAE